MTRYSQWFLVAFLLMAVSLGGCGREEGKVSIYTPRSSPEPITSTSAKAPITSEKDFRNIIVMVAEKNIPAVVHIEVTQSQEIANPFSPFEGDPFFRRFFNMPQEPRKFKRELKGIGTGMIMNSEGYILTNNHVVDGATQIQVILSDGKQYAAKIIGADPRTDLAVIRVSSTEKLPFVTFGDSDKVQVGEWVVAIGHPRGLDQTVTQGIISAKHRKGITDPNNYQDFLQTDAAINPGNSGGPLLNLDGQVIGVNAVIASQSGGSEGLGFAIPSTMAVHIANSLIRMGKVQRGWLGVSIQDVPFTKLKELGLETNKGAYVADVVKRGPADMAGVKAGDVIMTMDGKDIPDSSTLRNMVAGIAAGTEVKLGIVRDGKKMTLNVKVRSLDEASGFLTASAKEKLGIDVRPLTDKDVQRFGIDKDQGVAISWLDPKGPMAMVGFEVDDVILGINGSEIGSVADFAALVNSLRPKQRIVLMAMDHRTGRTGNVQVEVR